jgi:hypothetical protein
MDDFDDIQIESGDLSAEQPQPHKPLGTFGFMFNKMTSDMNFVGIFTIVYGSITCLSIIGAVIGIPLIIAGLRLREAVDEFKIFQMSNNSAALRRAFEKQQRYFRILKILIIVSLVITALYIILVIIFGLFAFNTITSNENF